nr:hypothetical protein [Tanacetum cinerariifolium]
REKKDYLFLLSKILCSLSLEPPPPPLSIVGHGQPPPPSSCCRPPPPFSFFVRGFQDLKMNEAVKVAIQIQSDRLRNEAQRENDEFLRTAVNEQLKAKVLTRSSHSSRTSYAVAVDHSEMELKKILIEKIEGNKSIQHLNEQRNPYKAFVDAYESDKILLDTYGETVTLKRRYDDDEDKDEEPSAGSDRGSKRR